MGWTRYLSKPRYALVVLRELVATGRARRGRTFHGKELVLDFLFPHDRPPPQANKQARRHQPRLPDDVFSVIARFYWGGGLWAEEEAAVVAEVAEREAAAEEEASDSE